MRKMHRTQLVHEGQYIGKIDIESLEKAEEWFPYLSLEDARKLVAVRKSAAPGKCQGGIAAW